MNTPAAWFEEMQERAVLMGQAAEPADYFETGNAAMWMLSIADGIRALQASVLSHHVPVLLVGDEDNGGAP